MSKNTVFVGLDVHLNSISVAIAEDGRNGEVRYLGTIDNKQSSISKKFRNLKEKYKEIHACYEAGPCGYVLYWQLIGMGINCDVIAPTLIPKKAGERVKTDRLDSIKLAQNHRSGDLTSVWVPDLSHEALRDLARAREAIKKDQRTAKHRLNKLLIKTAVRKPKDVNNWTQKYMLWLKTLEFDQKNLEYVFQTYLAEVEHQTDRLKRIETAIDVAIEESPPETREVYAALQLMRGISKITAVGIVTEIGNFSRFSNPNKLMAYAGVVPSEYSSGGPTKKKQGGITKTGNNHLRRLIVESAWNYRFQPNVNLRMKKCQKEIRPELVSQITGIAWKAQHRLCGRYRSLLNSGKSKPSTVTAVGRELLGFIWDIAVHVENQQKQEKEKRPAA